jgi:hypothetical protein
MVRVAQGRDRVESRDCTARQLLRSSRAQSGVARAVHLAKMNKIDGALPGKTELWI